MKPTLNGFSKSKSQDWVFVNTLAYQTEPLQRGDIVVFISHKGKMKFEEITHIFRGPDFFLYGPDSSRSASHQL